MPIKLIEVALLTLLVVVVIVILSVNKFSSSCPQMEWAPKDMTAAVSMLFQRDLSSNSTHQNQSCSALVSKQGCSALISKLVCSALVGEQGCYEELSSAGYFCIIIFYVLGNLVVFQLLYNIYHEFVAYVGEGISLVPPHLHDPRFFNIPKCSVGSMKYYAVWICNMLLGEILRPLLDILPL